MGSERVSIDCFIAEDGKGPYPNGADGTSDIEGKVARVAMSKLGNERVSIWSRSRVVRVEGRGAKTKEECCARYQVRETGSLILAFCFSCDFCYVRAPAIL